MIFAVFDPSPLTVCINCSFFTFIIIITGLPTHSVSSTDRICQLSVERRNLPGSEPSTVWRQLFHAVAIQGTFAMRTPTEDDI